MNIIKFFLDEKHGNYSYKDASNEKLTILGDFLSHDVGFRPLPFKEYALNNSEQYTCSNATTLEKKRQYIIKRLIF